MKEIVTVKEAAAFLHKHPDTIRRWIEEKTLRARKLSAGKNGIYAIARSDLLELAVSDALKRNVRQKKKQSPPSPSPQVHLPI
ncbi:helix-turn-helix domain-containing protein [Candidatus Gottesmanbacteria bacterium]|nr:helix-turn-helix domain-containing protein [Candidatus Gottesmanbacteria bacterium]